MSEKTSPSPRSQHWKTVKAEIENKQIINTYLNKRHQGIKLTNLCMSEISLC